MLTPCRRKRYSKGIPDSPEVRLMSRSRSAAGVLLAGVGAALALLPGPAAVAQKPAPKAKPAAKAPQATPAGQLRVAKGFQAELLYSVPPDKEGSWVSLCADPKGRLIVSDQYGGLFRVTPPPVGRAGETKVEKLPAPVGQAQGLLWAFDALYAVAN